MSSGLDLAPKVFEHLPVVRNFYAHKNQGTYELLSGVADAYLIPARRATEIMASAATTDEGVRPQPLLLDWLADVSTVIAAVV